MRKLFGIGLVLLWSAFSGAHAQSKALPRLQVAAGGHYLQTEDGKPFFWLGDTAWELIHHTTRSEASYYLHTRAEQGFNVIQTVGLSELDGLAPSALGHKPFLDSKFTQPNPAYFDRLVGLVDEAALDGLYVALVPVWGDKLTAPWGSGPRIFTLGNLPAAHAFGRYVATRLRDRTNVIWILGGDRPARVKGMGNRRLEDKATAAGFPADVDWTPIWREIAAGIAEGNGGKPLITYHPQGGEQSSSSSLHSESWLSLNGMQSGHGGGHDQPVWNWVARDFALSPAKPTIDLEPNYEDHPVNPWPTWDAAAGYFRDLDVRKQAYRSVFAGACGVTYGHHAVWGFINARNQPITFADMGWVEAMQRPGGRQMRYLRDLIESRPSLRRLRDPELIEGPLGEGGLHIEAMRDSQNTYAMIYIPTSDTTVRVRMDRIKAQSLQAWWYDPRTGIGMPAELKPGPTIAEFRTPSYGPDWVLVLDDPAAHYAPPGLEKAR